MSILDDRARHYGPGDENMSRIARLWSAYLNLRSPLTPSEVAWMMVMVKASRARVDPDHLDNYEDARGYASLAERLRSMR